MKLIPTSVNPVTITLYRGVPFDNNYEEHTFLSNFKMYKTGETPVDVGHNKEDFLDVKVGVGLGHYAFPRTTKSGTFNFAFGNGLVTSVVMELTDDEINSNYMKVVSGTDVYYYFITGVTQKNECTYLLNLELDVLMTYETSILTNLENKPILVERKHCRRILSGTRNNVPYKKVNSICFNQESIFKNIKSNVIKSFTPLEFRDYINQSSVDYGARMQKLTWYYIIVGIDFIASFIPDSIKYKLTYEENGIKYPYLVLWLCNRDIKLTFSSGGSSHQITIKCNEFLNEYVVGNPKVQKIILSPYPPYSASDNIGIDDYTSTDYVYFDISNANFYASSSPALGLLTYNSMIDESGSLFSCILDNENKMLYPLISKGYGGKYRFKTLTNYFSSTSPTKTDAKDTGEYKLQIAPFKDLRITSVSGEEYSIKTQYLFLKGNLLDASWSNINFYTITSTNPENNIYYYGDDVTNYDIESKLGTGTSVSYNFPTGTDAEMVFNMTSKNQYETSKITAVVTNAVKAIGGALAIAYGPSLMTKIAGGIAIASGVVGETSTIVDWSAKMEDLKNTPNSYNFSGNSFSQDKSIASAFGTSTMYPYLLEYGVSDETYQIGSDFLYNYGYEYNHNTYFNKEIREDEDNIFERQVFNYVKLREDITTKLVGDSVTSVTLNHLNPLPPVIAKKVNEIFNAGIKLWTFFNMDMTMAYVSYFQKETYCNPELIYSNLV